MESKANPQTKASAKWNKKAGYVAKSYKLKGYSGSVCRSMQDGRGKSGRSIDQNDE